MSTPDSRKLRLAATTVALVLTIYGGANLFLLALADRVEAAGDVYPYKQEDWLRYLLPALFESRDRPRLMIAGPSTARENLAVETFAEEFPDYSVFQGGISMGTLEDTLLSLEYIERVYGAEALPAVLVMGISPRFVATIPNARGFPPAIEAYSPYFGIEGEPGALRLRPKSFPESVRSRFRFLTRKQTRRYRTAFLATVDALVPDSFDRLLRESNLETIARIVPAGLRAPVVLLLQGGVHGYVTDRASPYKYRHDPQVDPDTLARALDDPAGWPQQVYAWDAAADAGRAAARLGQLADFVRAHGIRLFVVNLPERKVFHDRFDPSRYAHYEELVRTAVGEWPFFDARDILADDEFYDGLHATGAGALHLTQLVISFLREHGLRTGTA